MYPDAQIVFLKQFGRDESIGRWVAALVIFTLRNQLTKHQTAKYITHWLVSHKPQRLLIIPDTGCLPTVGQMEELAAKSILALEAQREWGS